VRKTDDPRAVGSTCCYPPAACGAVKCSDIKCPQKRTDVVSDDCNIWEKGPGSCQHECNICMRCPPVVCPEDPADNICLRADYCAALPNVCDNDPCDPCADDEKNAKAAKFKWWNVSKNKAKEKAEAAAAAKAAALAESENEESED
jgi:hypothetical protein